MEKYLGPYESYLYAAMRIFAGLLFLEHGLQKLLGFFGGVQGSGGPVEFGLIWVAGLIELVGGLLIALGVYAGWAAFICSGQMAAAYFMAHAPQGFFPIQNRGELAVLYCWVFLFMAARGSGAFALVRPRA